MPKTKSLALILGVLIMSLLVGYLVLAWTEPSTYPPGGNVSAPINVSTTYQEKKGGLAATAFYDYNGPSWYIDPASSGYAALFNGSVGIGTTSPAASSLLDLTSTTKGFLVPRMTTAQRNAISSPATGLMIYNTDTSQFNFYNGTSWTAIGAGGGGFTCYPTCTSNYLAKFTGASTIGDSLIYDNGTNIGIGKVLPSYKLDVNGNAMISDNLGVGTAPSTYYRIYASGGQYGIEGEGSTVGGYFKDTNDNTDVVLAYGSWGVYTDYSGYFARVGIGTSPSYSLDVNGALRLQPRSAPGGANGVIYYDSGSNKFRCYQNGAWVDCIGGGGGGISWPLLAPDGSAAAPSYSFTNNSNMGMFRAGADTLAFSTAGSERLRIDGSGNVGIGTTSPGYKLDVQAGSTNGIRAVSTGTYGVYGSGGYGVYGSGVLGVYGSGTNTGVYGYGDTGVYGSGSTYGVYGSGVYGVYGSGSSWGFYTPNSSYFGGNVGIGTTSPGSYKLNVNGNIWTSGLDVGGNEGITGNLSVGGNEGITGNLSVGGKIYGWNVPSSIDKTYATHNGNFGGYQAMYNWIQTNGCSGYHVCDATELTRAAQNGLNPPAECWYNSGIIDYYQSYGTGSAGDCRGWTYAGADAHGLIWFGKSIPLTCDSATYVCCCR